MPKCIWHSVEHLVCTVIFGKLSCLHCGLGPLTDPPCPLSALLSLPPSCAVPAPPSSSRARWHFVEQVPCVLWARPERTFCTRAHYADTTHCRTRRDPTLAPSASLSHALVAPPAPRSLWRPAAPLAAPWRHAGIGSGLCHVRRRPSHQRTTAAPEHRPCLSSRSSERVRRRHDTLQLQESGRRRSYLLPPRSQPRDAIKGNPEPLRALRRPPTFPLAIPWQWFGPERLSSPTPAGSAAAKRR